MPRYSKKLSSEQPGSSNLFHYSRLLLLLVTVGAIVTVLIVTAVGIHSCGNKSSHAASPSRLAKASTINNWFRRLHRKPVWHPVAGKAWAIVSRPKCDGVGWCMWLSHPSALESSKGKYWPASSIKLWAVVAAYKTLYSVQLTGNSRLELRTRSGRLLKRTTVNREAKRTIERSSNRGYDLLARIARVDNMNQYALQYGLYSTYLGQAYASRSLNKSPAIYSRGRLRLPAYISRHPAPRCRARSNCTSLLDLQKIMYGVVHNHFNLRRMDWLLVRNSLSRVRSGGTKIVRSWCRQRPLRTWSKGGFVSGYDKIEVIYYQCGMDSWLITLSVPAPRGGGYYRRLRDILRKIQQNLP